MARALCREPARAQLPVGSCWRGGSAKPRCHQTCQLSPRHSRPAQQPRQCSVRRPSTIPPRRLNPSYFVNQLFLRFRKSVCPHNGPPVRGPTSCTKRARNRTGMRVLLIEDDSATAQSIELMLKSESFNIYTTDLGEEAVDLGKLYDYDSCSTSTCPTCRATRCCARCASRRSRPRS